MIPLPKELQPWREALALFPDEIAGEIGKLLPRLAFVVGPVRAWRGQEGGEPEGFSGIGRRGSYERLLLTEWLLADEVPDEFARRAAMGEHAFFQVARRTPARAATSAAIFDCGPDQLGGPRVAHLAALIVLAARAERAGARFAWGLLSDPEGALSPSVTVQSVGRLLAGRTAIASGPEDVAAWAARAARSAWEDAWLVGAPARVVGWPHASLGVEDVLLAQRDEGAPRLAITARAPRSSPRTIELVLPAAPLCARLLRDPFTVAAPAPPPRPSTSGAAPASNLVFATNGTKVFARGGDGEIISYAVPASPNEAPRRPKRYGAKADGVVAAVGWVKRGLVMVVVTPSDVILEHVVNHGPDLLDTRVVRPANVRIAIPTAADPLAVLGYQESLSAAAGTARPEARPHMAVFLDARRALIRIRSMKAGESDLQVVASEVAALACSPNAVTFVGRGTRPTAEPTAGDPKGFQKLPFHLDADDPLDLRWHHVVAPAYERFGNAERLPGDGSFESVLGREVAAIQQGGDTWTILGGKYKPRPRLTPPAGTRVVGVWEGLTDGEPELVLLEADGLRLSFLGRSTARTLVRSSAPIVDVASSSWRQQIAFATSDGEVVIVNLRDGAELARYAP